MISAPLYSRQRRDGYSRDGLHSLQTIDGTQKEVADLLIAYPGAGRADRSQNANRPACRPGAVKRSHAGQALLTRSLEMAMIPRLSSYLHCRNRAFLIGIPFIVLIGQKSRMALYKSPDFRD
jgi:hypothetical protein